MKRILAPILLLTFLFPAFAQGQSLDEWIGKGKGLLGKGKGYLCETTGVGCPESVDFKDLIKRDGLYSRNSRMYLLRERPRGKNRDHSIKVRWSVFGSTTGLTDTYGRKGTSKTVRKTVFGSFTELMDSYRPKRPSRTVGR